MQTMTDNGYHSETATIPFGDGTITLENLTPILTPKERERRKREIERGLYDVFRKYAPGKDHNNFPPCA